MAKEKAGRFWPIPDVMQRDIVTLRPRLFLNRGIRLLVLDLDNTLATYREDSLSPAVLDWCRRMQEAGLELFLLSNNRGSRPSLFAEQLRCEYLGRARKPGRTALLSLLEKKKLRPEQAALIGDQIYTDVFCAVRAGVFSVLLRPIAFTNPWLALRYGLEAPFRGIYLWKHGKK